MYSPLFSLSSLTLSPLSLISRPCLSSLTLSPLSLISRLSIAEPSSRNPAPYHAIDNPAPYHAHLSSLSLILVSSSPNPVAVTQHHITPSATATRNPTPQSIAHEFATHEFAIHDPRFNMAKPTRWNQHGEHGETNTAIHDPRIRDPRPMIYNRSSASTSSSWSEWSFGFYWSQVMKFRIFCLWVMLIDAFLVDLWSFGCLSWWVIVGLFHHLVGNEGSGGSYRSEKAENEREERDGRENIFEIYYFIM